MIIGNVSTHLEQTVQSFRNHSALLEKTTEAHNETTRSSKALRRKSRIEERLLEQKIHSSYESSSVYSIPNSKEVKLLEKCFDAYEHGDYALALKLLNHLLPIAPDSFPFTLCEMYRMRGNCNAFMGKYALAIEDYNRSLSHPTLVYYGPELEARTKLCRSICYLFLEKDKNRDPESDWFWPSLGVAGLEDIAEQGNLLAALALVVVFPEIRKEGEEISAKTIELDPSLSKYTLEVAQMFFKMGKFKKAIRVLASIEKIEGQDLNRELALELRGVCYALLGNYQAALQDLNGAMEIYDEIPYYMERGIIHHLLGDKTNAQLDFQKAAEDSLNYPEAILLQRLLGLN